MSSAFFELKADMPKALLAQAIVFDIELPENLGKTPRTESIALQFQPMRGIAASSFIERKKYAR